MLEPGLSPVAATATRRVAIAIDDPAMARDVARVMKARGLATLAVSLDSGFAAIRGAGAAIAHIPDVPLEPLAAARLAPVCAAAATAKMPVAILANGPPVHGRAAAERAAAAAYLAAYGAIIVADPDAWLETVILLACHGLPAGPRVAVVAPPGTWLAAQAHAQVATAERARILTTVGKSPRADAVLVDRAETGAAQPRDGLLIIPAIGRAELCAPAAGEPVPLCGLAPSLAAVAAAGRLSERLGAGFGPAPMADGDRLHPDRERIARQLAKLGEGAGDHETKVLLAAYGVPVIRQAVATTASAATRVAKKAGFPVEIKPWDPALPTEAEGCPVERRITSAAEVRRAFSQMVAVAGARGGAVIVRATPPAGRELSIRFSPCAPLGLMAIARITGVPDLIAAPAPLRAMDAAAIAARVEASRSDDPEPDREALADLLVRASHLAATDAIAWLELSTVVCAPRPDGAVVVDARCGLSR
ncbi:MAG TPA: acetate--CoA ligase family protein [Kofleriaceae bacterium]|nr:acetate--CoA ligase family protein [Kofleriaceae bacterium]